MQETTASAVGNKMPRGEEQYLSALRFVSPVRGQPPQAAVTYPGPLRIARAPLHAAQTAAPRNWAGSRAGSQSSTEGVPRRSDPHAHPGYGDRGEGRPLHGA